MTDPGPEALDLLLSCYLDGELDLDTRLDLEGWLRTRPEARDRLGQLSAVQAALGGLRAQGEVHPRWTVRAYRVGLARTQAPLRRMLYLGLGQAMARPRALGHGLRPWRVCRRRRVKLRRP